MDYFVLQICLRWVEENIFLILQILTHTSNQNVVKYFIINVKAKKGVPIKMTFKLAKSQKRKKKYNLSLQPNKKQVKGKLPDENADI